MDVVRANICCVSVKWSVLWWQRHEERLNLMVTRRPLSSAVTMDPINCLVSQPRYNVASIAGQAVVRARQGDRDDRGASRCFVCDYSLFADTVTTRPTPDIIIGGDFIRHFMLCAVVVPVA